jgi:hypothetical protein
MKFNEFAYRVEATVTFTREERRALIVLAKLHYDQTCVAAGLKIDEEHPKWGVGRVNGFLAQLDMFTDGDRWSPTKVTWPFGNFDITLKILEMRRFAPSGTERAICERLWDQLQTVCDRINEEYKRLKEAAVHAE